MSAELLWQVIILTPSTRWTLAGKPSPGCELGVRGMCQAGDVRDVQCCLWRCSRASTGKLCSFPARPPCLAATVLLLLGPWNLKLGCGSEARSIPESSRAPVRSVEWAHDASLQRYSSCCPLCKVTSCYCTMFSQGIQLSQSCISQLEGVIITPGPSLCGCRVGE